MAKVQVHDVGKWVEENKHMFVPPVCNECMFSDQLKVFFIGGPNQRKDYHNNAGEEMCLRKSCLCYPSFLQLFFQLNGDMCLKVVEKGKFKDVHIKEGEVFLLPGRVPHSPQRYESTVGFVVERTRATHEHDGLRYYVEDGTQTALFERWFHLTDIVKDLPPVIKAYFASDEHKTGQPNADSVQRTEHSFDPDGQVSLMEPIDLTSLISQHDAEIKLVHSTVGIHDKKLQNFFQADKVDGISKGCARLFGPEYKTAVHVYGTGEHDIEGHPTAETFVWLEKGSASICTPSGTHKMASRSMADVPPNTKFTLEVGSDTHVVTVVMVTPDEK